MCDLIDEQLPKESGLLINLWTWRWCCFVVRCDVPMFKEVVLLWCVEITHLITPYLWCGWDIISLVHLIIFMHLDLTFIIRPNQSLPFPPLWVPNHFVDWFIPFSFIWTGLLLDPLCIILMFLHHYPWMFSWLIHNCDRILSYIQRWLFLSLVKTPYQCLVVETVVLSGLVWSSHGKGHVSILIFLWIFLCTVVHVSSFWVLSLFAWGHGKIIRSMNPNAGHGVWCIPKGQLLPLIQGVLPSFKCLWMLSPTASAILLLPVYDLYLSIFSCSQVEFEFYQLLLESNIGECNNPVLFDQLKCSSIGHPFLLHKISNNTGWTPWDSSIAMDKHSSTLSNGVFDEWNGRWKDLFNILLGHVKDLDHFIRELLKTSQV